MTTKKSLPKLPISKPVAIMVSAAESERQRKLRTELKAAIKNKSMKKAAKLARALHETPLYAKVWPNSDAPMPRIPKKKSSNNLTGRFDRKKSKKKRKANPELEIKRWEMKELFREIDAWNFPTGTRLTTNLSGRTDRGGGLMSNRRKF